MDAKPRGNSNSMAKDKRPSVSVPGQRELPVSRYSMMKSKRHQLNTILNEYSEPKISHNKEIAIRKQLNPLNKKFQHRNISHQKSNSLLGNQSKKKADKRFLLSEYSEFLQHSGMTDEGSIRQAGSPDKDRKNDVSDIDGATSYNRQLSTSKPLDTDYDRFGTFKNHKKTFVVRRAEAGFVDSKRNLRSDDIDGAIPKLTKSITQSKRLKIKSSDIKDLLHDIEKYRKQCLDKNGKLAIESKKKLEVPHKTESLNIFDSAATTDQGESDKKRGMVTPGKRVPTTFDQIGLVRDDKQHKSQPRNVGYHRETSLPPNGRVLQNTIVQEPSITFSKRVSQRKERLEKLRNGGNGKQQLTFGTRNKPGSKSCSRNINMHQLPTEVTRSIKKEPTKFDTYTKNKQVRKIERVLENVNRNRDRTLIQPDRSMSVFEKPKGFKIDRIQRKNTPERKQLKPYHSRVTQDRNRSYTSQKMHGSDIKDKRQDEMTRNSDIYKNNYAKDNRFKANVSEILVNDKHLSAFKKKKTIPRPILSLNPKFTGSVSQNDIMLNQFLYQRRNEQEKLNKIF